MRHVPPRRRGLDGQLDELLPHGLLAACHVHVQPSGLLQRVQQLQHPAAAAAAQLAAAALVAAWCADLLLWRPEQPQPGPLPRHRRVQHALWRVVSLLPRAHGRQHGLPGRAEPSGAREHDLRRQHRVVHARLPAAARRAAAALAAAAGRAADRRRGPGLSSTQCPKNAPGGGQRCVNYTAHGRLPVRRVLLPLAACCASTRRSRRATRAPGRSRRRRCTAPTRRRSAPPSAPAACTGD